MSGVVASPPSFLQHSALWVRLARRRRSRSPIGILLQPVEDFAALTLANGTVLPSSRPGHNLAPCPRSLFW